LIWATPILRRRGYRPPSRQSTERRESDSNPEGLHPSGFKTGWPPIGAGRRFQMFDKGSGPAQSLLARWSEGGAETVILPKERDPRFITIRRGGTLKDSRAHNPPHGRRRWLPWEMQKR